MQWHDDTTTNVNTVHFCKHSAMRVVCVNRFALVCMRKCTNTFSVCAKFVYPMLVEQIVHNARLPSKRDEFVC